MTVKLNEHRRILIRHISILLVLSFFAFSSSVYAGATGVLDSTTYRNARDTDPKPYMTKEFELPDSGLLKVFTVAGNIEVIPSSSAQKVKVELYLDRGFAFWSNANNLDNFRISILKRGNEIVASVERKKRDSGFFSDRTSFSFRVYVPESMSTDLKTLGGNISLNNVHGEQAVKTGRGNVTLKDVSGQIKAYTSGGNIEISDSQGTIFAQTEGGNILLDRSSGEFRLRTKGGRIISERISGTMLARVGGGDISADFMRVGEGINLETSAGDINLSVPNQVGYELLLQGTEVHFTDSENVRGDVQTGRIKGTYQDSGPPINLLTNSGTIRLRIK